MRRAGRLDGSFIGFAQQSLQVGAHHLDRVQALAVGRQRGRLGTDGVERVADGFAFAAAEVVGDDDVAAVQRQHQESADLAG